MEKYYIDLGSSTIKAYKYDQNKLSLIEEHSIYFKNDFDSQKGISQQNEYELFSYFQNIKTKHGLNFENTFIFATGIFRNLCDDKKTEMITKFNQKLNLYFNIISHGIENYYLGKAMEADYNNKKVMIINMGGKTTELVTFKDNLIVDRKNLQVGVADLLNAFPDSNDKYSTVKINDMVDFVKERIKKVKFDSDYDCAVFTGGEYRFEKLTGYKLQKNTLFNDGIHDLMVTFENFVKGNNKIFYKITLQELYDLMPTNPKWMDGARAGAVLPQAIFERANIKYIVPSDLNLINGVIKDI